MAVQFLIGGVQKGGTTALDDYLREHPALQMSSPKEAHFFDNEEIDWRSPDYSIYDRFFPTNDDRIRGEATPIYIYWPNSLERIQRYRPDMKLILVFRDPVQRAWSHWRMEHDRGWDREPFAWCIREGRARVGTDETAPGHHRIFSYVERGFYGQQLERVLGLFPREQLLLLRSEDLRHDPGAVLDRVCDFLKVDPAPRPLRRRELNVGREGKLDELDADHLRRLYRSDLERFAELSGLDVRSWLGAAGPDSKLQAQER